MNYFSNDTIAAIATAPGDGAIAIIRLSGKKAFSIVNSLFSKDLNKMLSHTCHLGKFYDENKVLIDEVLLLIMKNPHSFTGEDVVEIHSHGGRIVTEKILKTLIQNGARAASAGEFSFRAFQNKKIDLTQAEAIQNLIAAKNEKALLAAEKHLEGALKRKVLSFQRNLLEITAILEAWVDFPEEELELTSIQEINKQIENEKKKLIQLIETYHDGKALFEGMTLAICGTPNVGKSSLLNALLKKDRAIVTDIEGTTRDLLEETIQIKNMHFKLIDTAGIRTTNDCIEKEGIKRSLLAIEKADIVILVLDASRPLAEDDRNLIKKADPQSTLLLWNKIDLKDPSDNLDFPFHAHISAQKEKGISKVKEMIYALVQEKLPSMNEEVIISSYRHKSALSDAIQNLNNVQQGLLLGHSPEFLAADMRYALESLSTIIGQNISEDILTNIFSKFCIGK